ncbi:MAG: SEL1-like repeat protein [Parachlamydiaceae bacterium]|nr:SEL1-like repeat protein [Parachlamydiaceae bacterium]
MEPIKNNAPLESLYFTPQMKGFSENVFKISAVASIAFMGLTSFALFTGASLALPVTLGILSGITLMSSFVFLKLISGYAENQYQFGKNSKEIKISAPHVLIAEKLGHTKAKFLVGYYWYNQSSSRDKGIKKIKEAANLGCAKAQYCLSEFYLKGLTTDNQGQLHDQKKGLELLAKAATKGYAPAQYQLGKIYQSGEASEAGCNRNLVKAKELYRKAAAQENAEAKYALAHFDSNNEYYDRHNS